MSTPLKWKRRVIEHIFQRSRLKSCLVFSTSWFLYLPNANMQFWQPILAGNGYSVRWVGRTGRRTNWPSENISQRETKAILTLRREVRPATPHELSNHLFNILGKLVGVKLCTCNFHKFDRHPEHSVFRKNLSTQPDAQHEQQILVKESNFAPRGKVKSSDLNSKVEELWEILDFKNRLAHVFY